LTGVDRADLGLQGVGVQTVVAEPRRHLVVGSDQPQQQVFGGQL
jgi:hypothetical protein